MAATKRTAAAAGEAAVVPEQDGAAALPTPDSMIEDAAVADSVVAAESSAAPDAPEPDTIVSFTETAADPEAVLPKVAIYIIDMEAILGADGEVSVDVEPEAVRTVVLTESLQRPEMTYAPGMTLMMPSADAERLLQLGAAVDPDAPAEVVVS